ncbi:QPCTL protein, partial [Columbina picui]|nr:QPCTL protein [Columbina picui]
LSPQSLLVLLDLLGAPGPAIHSHFPQTQRWFLRLVAIGVPMSPVPVPCPRVPLLSPYLCTVPVSHRRPRVPAGVPVLHVIPLPFPRVWHTFGDTEENLHPPTVRDLARVLLVFVAEALRL